MNLLRELLFSIYFPFLILSAHEGDVGGRWGSGLLYWCISRGYLRGNVGIEDYRIFFADFLLFWLSAAVVFALLWLFSQFSFTRAFVGYLALLVCIAGFPLVCWYRNRNGLPFLIFELAIAGVLLANWVYRRWSLSAPSNIGLLAVHFTLWSTLGGGYLLKTAAWIPLWPPWYLHWGINKLVIYTWLVYPALGFCSTLLWATYFRQSVATERHARPAGAGGKGDNSFM